MSTHSVNAPSPSPAPPPAGGKAGARGAGFDSFVKDAQSSDVTAEAPDEGQADSKPSGDSILAGLLGIAFPATVVPTPPDAATAGAVTFLSAQAAAPAGAPSDAKPADAKSAGSGLAAALQAQVDGLKAAGAKPSQSVAEAKRALAEAGVVTLKGESSEDAPKLAAPGSQSKTGDSAPSGVLAAPQIDGAKGKAGKAAKGDASKIEAAQAAALKNEGAQADEIVTPTGEPGAEALGEAKPAEAARPDGARPGQAPERIQTSAAPATPSAQSGQAAPSLAVTAAVQVANQIATHASSRRTRFEVQLDPGELGRVDVRLDIQHDGRVATRLIVERPETLDMLRNDARELSKTLEQAGFQLGQGGLAFQLRDGRQSYPGQEAGASGVGSGEDDIEELPPIAAVYSRGPAAGGGVDIKA